MKDVLKEFYEKYKNKKFYREDFLKFVVERGKMVSTAVSWFKMLRSISVIVSVGKKRRKMVYKIDKGNFERYIIGNNKRT